MIKLFRQAFALFIVLFLSACVTQQYIDENDNPIIQNDATNNEIAMTRISLGIGYLNMGNTKQAKLNLEKAKRFAPNLVQVHTAFAHYYDTVGEAEQAITAYEKALSIDSYDADTLNNYGVFLCRQGQLAKAEKQFLRAIAVPSYILVSESYENLALCHLQAEHFAKAEEYLDKAIEHSPTRASSLLQKANVLYAKGDYQGALAFIKRYEKSTRRFSPAALALSFKTYEKLRDNKTAKNYATMLLKMFPNSYEAKQYVLNGLTEIEADKLADAYKMKHVSKKKKRVVVLKPKSGFPTPVKKAPAQIKTIESSPPQTDTQAAKLVSPPAVKQAAEQDAENTAAPLTAAPLSSVEKFLAKSTANAEKVLAEKKSELNEAIKVENNNPDQVSINLPIHIVEKGDSLFSISKHYNIHMRALTKWNRINKTKMIKIGDVIYLADPKKVRAK
ncbi:MAG: type IV pilus biogenesis/stability protein PilW [Thalassotalea sp.]